MVMVRGSETLVLSLVMPPLPRAGEGWGEGGGTSSPHPPPSPASGRRSQSRNGWYFLSLSRVRERVGVRAAAHRPLIPRLLPPAGEGARAATFGTPSPACGRGLG